MSLSVEEKQAIKLLIFYYNRNGYVRLKNEQRAIQVGTQKYKKGNEIRLVANSEDELIQIQKLLKVLKFKFGNTNKINNRFRIPIYGIDQVARFLLLVNDT